jgi:3-oxoadipate enol-lactonase
VDGMLGCDQIGTDGLPVIVMNDWTCDTSTWDGARAYLDQERFRWVFADLRGYGRSRGRRGDYTLAEAAVDVVELADSLGVRPNCFRHSASS